MDLISGLPEDIARECLVRVSYNQFPTVATVCKGWKTEVESPEFRRQRRSTGHSQKILVTVQARSESVIKSEPGSTKRVTNPVYFLSVFEPETGNWSELTPPPGFESGLPMFCQVAGVGSDLVLMGGLDPDTWKASNSVFVYSFLTAKWARGSHMPGEARSFFGCCGSDDDVGMVFVAGGHDDEKNALRSALAYDVSRDVWVPLPDMAAERDECKAVFRRGRVYVVGGYCTERQGQFDRSAEVFDVATWQWGHVMEGFLDSATCPKTLIDGEDEERVYMCIGGELMVKEELESLDWKRVASLPGEICHVAHVGALDGGVLVIGSSGYGEAHVGFLFDVRSNSWRRLDSPLGFRGHVQTGWLFKI